MRTLFAACAALITTCSFGATEYLGLYMNGNKIGYSEYTSAPAQLAGKPVTKSDSKTVMDTSLLGTSLKIEMNSTTWSAAGGKPVRMSFTMESAGRKQVVDASFSAKTVAITIDNSGQKTQKNLPLPNGTVIDDPIAMVVSGALKPGATRTFYVLDPMSATFLKNEVKVVGKAKATVQGKAIDGTLVEVLDPRAMTKIYLSAKGDLVKADGPMGIEMIPVSKAIALAPSGKYAPSSDLAYSTSLTTDKPITDPASLSRLRLRITANNLRSVPSGDHQKAIKDGDSWIIDSAPPKIAQSVGSIAAAAKEKPEWTRPSLHVPSDSAKFKSLAAQIVGGRKGVAEASKAIQAWVYQQMKPNAGIGVLRDATEVLQTKEGVCRDYAILTTTLLRSAGIPTRLASGLVNWDGTFYYHAWAEVWDGERWIGIDSTTDRPQISAAHIKLGEGNVEEAFTFTFLDRAKIEVLGSSRE